MTFDSANNQMILITMAPWKTAVAYTWDGVSGQWQSHTLGTYSGNPLRGLWPTLSWDSSRNMAWVTATGFLDAWVGFLIDPSDWSLTLAFAVPFKAGISPYAYAASTIPWNGSRALFIFGGVATINRGGYSHPQDDPYNLFGNDASAVVETSPGTYSLTSLTAVNPPPATRANMDCVVDDDSNKVYIVGGRFGDPFQPTPRTDTWEGVVDATGETITWTNLGEAPPSSLGWGVHLTAR
jgi:hypothetical protein